MKRIISTMIAITVLLTSILLVSCSNGNTSTESSGSSVEASVTKSSESTTESGSSEASEEPESESSPETASEESSATAAGDNIFTVAFSCTDSVISPAKANFGTTMGEILESMNLTEADINTNLGENAPRIIQTISIPGLSDQVMEVFNFYDDQLVSVEYMISLEDAAYETACQTLSEQSAVIPDELMLSAENGIASGQTTLWEDAEKNTLSVSFPNTGDSQPRVIMLSLSSAKPDLQEQQ